MQNDKIIDGMKVPWDLYWTDTIWKGLSLSAERQMVSFRGKTERLEPMQIILLQYLYDHAQEYIFKDDIKELSDSDSTEYSQLKGINLSKTISEILRRIKNVIPDDEHDKDNEYLESFIKKIQRGHPVGYQFQVDFAVLNPDVDMEPDSDEEDYLPYKEGILFLFRKNWLSLFIWLLSLLLFFMTLSLFGTSVGGFFISILQAPKTIIVPFLIFLSILPAICGYVIDIPIAVHAYRKRTGISSSLSWEQIRRISRCGDDEKVIKGAGRFHAEWKHNLLFVLCNSTGAMCTLSLLLFAQSLPDFSKVVSDLNLSFFYGVLLIMSLCFTILHDWHEQRKRRPKSVDDLHENRDTYLSNRIHVIINIIHIIFNMGTSFTLLLCCFCYSFSQRAQGKIPLDNSYCYAVISYFFFVWISAASPLVASFHDACRQSVFYGSFLVLIVSCAYLRLCFQVKPTQIGIIAFSFVCLFALTYLLPVQKEQERPLTARTSLSLATLISLSTIAFLLISLLD